MTRPFTEPAMEGAGLVAEPGGRPGPSHEPSPVTGDHVAAYPHHEPPAQAPDGGGGTSLGLAAHALELMVKGATPRGGEPEATLSAIKGRMLGADELRTIRMRLDELYPAPAGTNIVVRQLRFCEQMARREGTEVSYPPTPSQLQDYFRSFRTEREHPDEDQAFQAALAADPRDVPDDGDLFEGARLAFTAYAEAFYVHVGSTRPGGDLAYHGAETTIGERTFTSSAPRSWADVTAKRERVEHQRVIDCEGFAFLANQLLGPDGYGCAVEFQVFGTKRPGRASGAHVVTVLTDPRSGESMYQSNKSVGRSLEMLLNDLTVRPPVGRGRTQDEATADMLRQQQGPSR